MQHNQSYPQNQDAESVETMNKKERDHKTGHHNILASSEIIQERLIHMAEKINRDYACREIDLVCLGNSASMFVADLVRLVHIPMRQHLLVFSSYHDTPTSGAVRLTLDVANSLENRHILLAEGMIISGRTPLYLMDMLRLRRPASLEICAIGMKPSLLSVNLQVKYCLFDFDKEWVAGYGIGNGPEKVSANLINLASVVKE